MFKICCTDSQAQNFAKQLIWQEIEFSVFYQNDYVVFSSNNPNIQIVPDILNKGL